MLSVIVPVYNSRLYLNTLIDSILNQTYSDLELILVDDGSTDGSADICDKRMSEDHRIKVIHKENGGQSSARNEGMIHAKGNYITFADNDDFVHPEMYSTLMEVIEKENANVCACGFLNVQNSDFHSINITHPLGTYRKYTTAELIHDYFKPTWKIPVWNKIYKRDLLKDIQFENVHLGEDNLFSYQVIQKANSYIYVDDTMYFQRMHDMNYEFVGSKYMIELIRCKEQILHDIKKRNHQEYPRLQVQFLYECIRTYNSYKESIEMKKEVLELIQRNSDHILLRDIPMGHKKIFLGLKKLKYTKLPNEIII